MQNMDFDQVAPDEFGHRPEQSLWQDANLIAFDDQDEREWETLALLEWFGEPGGPDDDPEYQAWLASLPDIRDAS